MKIGFDMTYTISLQLYREGITVFNRFLFEALLETRPDLSLEFWCYESNLAEIRNAYRSLFEKYRGRVTVLTEVRYMGLKPLEFVSVPEFLLKSFRLGWAALTFQGRDELLNRKEEWKRSVFSFRRELKPPVNDSGADVAFISISPHCLNSEVAFSGPVILFIHDRQDMILRDAFKKNIVAVDELIAGANATLDRLARKGAFFTCYSSFIRDTCLLGCLPHLKKEQVRALKIPPILRKFENNGIPAEKVFRDKFRIEGPYIPFASLIRSNKNILLLLKALRRLKDSGLELKLVTTGTFNGNIEEQTYISANDLEENIVETGVLSEAELFALYKYAALEVVTTRAEGPGIAQQCLEALLVGGLPVIHTRAAGIEEALAQRGLSLETEDLNWVDCDDDATLAEKTREVLADPVKHVEKQKHIISHFTSPGWKETAGEFLSIMEGEILRHREKTDFDRNECVCKEKSGRNSM